MSNKLLTIWIMCEYWFIRLSKGRIEPKNAPIIRKGRPKPREYMASRYAPCNAVARAAARARMLASMGPTHAVQPREKATPMVKERKYPVVVPRDGVKRFS